MSNDDTGMNRKAFVTGLLSLLPGAALAQDKVQPTTKPPARRNPRPIAACPPGTNEAKSIRNRARCHSGRRTGPSPRLPFARCATKGAPSHHSGNLRGSFGPRPTAFAPLTMSPRTAHRELVEGRQ